MTICSTCTFKNYRRKDTEPSITNCTISTDGKHQSYNDLPAKEYSDGSKVWCSEGLCHRSRNLPAFICRCTDCGGSNIYAVKGKFHRSNGPAVEQLSEPFAKRWYFEGKEVSEEEYAKIQYDESSGIPNGFGAKCFWLGTKLHNDKGPAVVYEDGKTEWWLRGIPLTQEEIRARMNKPIPNEEIAGHSLRKYDGHTRHYFNGLLHKDDDGPAVIYSNGTKEYWKHGLLHRLEGPAVENRGFGGSNHWWIDGKKYTESEYKNEINLRKFKTQINIRDRAQSKEEKIMSNTLTQQLTQSLSKSHSWRQAVVDTVDVLARNGMCFSSGEIANHIQLERSDITFSFYQIGLMLKELFSDGDTMSFFDGKVTAVRALRVTSAGYEVYVYGPSMHLCESHDFEVNMSASVPSQAKSRTAPATKTNASSPLWPLSPAQMVASALSQRTTPVLTKRSKKRSKTSLPSTNRASRKANESTAVIHSGGRLAVPSLALQKLNVSPGDTVSFRTTNFGAGRTLEIARGHRYGWSSKRVSSNKGRSGRLYFGQKDIGSHFPTGSTKTIRHDSYENTLFVTL